MLRIRTKPHPKRPGVFIASLEGKTLCISRTPLADAARVLLKMGFPPATLVTMRHEGANHDSFVPETLANWGARSYVEREKGTVTIVPYEPYRVPIPDTASDHPSDSDPPKTPQPSDEDEQK
jgi:hypothetical protein